MSPITEPYSHLASPPHFMIGSSRTEPPFCSASRSAMRPAISNASAGRIRRRDSRRRHSVTLRSTTGNRQHAGPEHGFKPFLDAGTYSFGTDPPDDLVSKNESFARLQRFDHDFDLAYCPVPPVCFLSGGYVHLLGDLLTIGTCGAPILASTLVGALENVDLMSR